MENFYTYLWLRPDGTPYYVGKGINHRGFTSEMHRFPCPRDNSRIIIQEHPSESEAYLAEVFLIAYYGRKDLGTGCLRNLTDGGDCPPSRKGAKHTAESNQKNREAHLGKAGYWKNKKLSDEHTARMSASLKGRTSPRKGVTLTAETRSRISLSKKGCPSPMKGKRHTDEANDKNRKKHLGLPAWNKNLPCSDATKQKISIANKTLRETPEWRKRMSEQGKLGAKARWEKRQYGVEFSDGV
jgi:hypothetical protein